MTDMSYIVESPNLFEVKVKRLDVRISFHITSSVSRDQALAEAIAYRDDLYRRYNLPSRATERPNVRVNSRMGGDAISGVYVEIEKRVEKQYAYFVCKYYCDDLWQRKRFNIGMLGYQKAWREALDHRLLYHPLGSLKIEMQAPRPSLDKYIILSNLAPDVPLPIIEK